jgi:hypothetical protein
MPDDPVEMVTPFAYRDAAGNLMIHADALKPMLKDILDTIESGRPALAAEALEALLRNIQQAEHAPSTGVVIRSVSK